MTRSLLEEQTSARASEGLKPGKIACKIAEETGMSYRWVIQYLPDKLKERLGLEGLPRH